MKKIFVLDTNVLLHSAQSIKSFKDNIVVLPMIVIEELDKFKKYQDELGRNAREVIRTLDDLRMKGSLSEGVGLANSNGKTPEGILRIIAGKGHVSDALDMELPDNRILRVAYNLHRSYDEEVILISKDINLRIKADALGIPVMDFEKQKINFDELFSGYRELSVPAETINSFYKNKQASFENKNFYPNEFIMLRDETDSKHTAIAIAKDENELQLLYSRGDDVVWNIHPRSKEQRMALELLMNPEIRMVTLVGQAGSGKTLLALAAGLELVLEMKLFEKILVSRPIVPLGKDIGYLPGDKGEKLSNWMQPIYDNLDYLLHDDKKDSQAIRKQIEELIKNHLLDLEALTYIRGRSIPRQYIIIDEAQNLTPHEVKTIVSRAGEETKMVLTGDPYQIDNPYLDASSNGLTYAVERMKTLPIHGHITLKKSERSHLAAAAAEYL
jgi:PhoH-like ATPase